MADENIVQMPTVLERLATRINAYLARDAANRAEWVEIQAGICCALAEGKAQPGMASKIAFGQWCENNGFGADKISHQDRAAAITMGNDPTALCACLEVTERRSLRLIYEREFFRFTTTGKTTVRSKGTKKSDPKRSPEFLKAKDAIEALEARGKEVSHKAVIELAGVSDTPVRIALAEWRAEAKLLPLGRGDMNKTQEKRFEIALRKARAEIREELKAEVYAELDVFVRHWKERIEWCQRIEKNWNGVVSRDAYRLIRNCLHPDHNSFSRAAEAFDIFTKLEKVLVKPEPAPPPAGVPPLPSTVAELMAVRRGKR